MHRCVLNIAAQVPRPYCTWSFLRKKEVCTQRNILVQRFKICYVLCMRNHLVKPKIVWNENQKKNLHQVYLIHKLCLPIIFEIMANFEAFCWNISVNANLIFLKSDLVMMKNVIGFYYEIFCKVKHWWEGPQSVMKKISTLYVHIFGILPNATASQWHIYIWKISAKIRQINK